MVLWWLQEQLTGTVRLTSPDCEPSGTGGPSGAGGNNVGLNI